MEIVDILRIIRENAVRIALTTLIAMIITAIISFFFLEPVYRVEVKILINKQSEGGMEYNDILTNQKLTNTYEEILKSKRIAKMVINELQLQVNPDHLIDQLAVDSPKESQVIRVSMMGEDPQFLKLVVKQWVEVFKAEIGHIIRVENVEILDDVEMDEVLLPVKPVPVLNIAIAGVATVMTAVGLAIFLEFIDPTIRSIGVSRKIFGGIVFGPIPETALIRDEWKRKHRQGIRQFDRYRDTLRKIKAQLIALEGSGARYMISAPHKGMATQKVGYDLASTFAETGEKTLLIAFNGSNIPRLQEQMQDVQSRRAKKKSSFPLEDEITEPFEWNGPLDEIKPFFYQTRQHNLVFLGLSVEVLGRDKLYNPVYLENLMKSLHESFETIIVASSISMSEVSDSLFFMPVVNVSLLMMEKGKTLRDEIREAIYQMRHLPNLHLYGLYFDTEAEAPHTKPLVTRFKDHFRSKPRKRPADQEGVSL